MPKPIRILGKAFLTVILYLPIVRAQDSDLPKTDTREQPVPAYPAALPVGRTGTLAGLLNLDLNAGVQVAPDDQPLSGVQQQTVGPNLAARNFFMPSISATSQMATSSSSSGFAQPGVFTYVLGTLDFNHVTERSGLLLHYTGGGMFSSYLNSAIQDLELTYNFRWQRWSLLVGDDVSFLSESPFGFGGVGGLEFLGGGSPFGPGGFLNPILAPNQTIPTIIVPRVSNTAVSQIEYKVSPRSSWTASGTYGMLNFLGIGYINSAQAQFQTGYNYLLSPLSSVAVIYRFDDFRFTHLPQSIGDQAVQIGYSRRVTGRMSFQVAVGPSMQMLRGVLTGYGNHFSWALDSSLNYQMSRTSLLFSYDHLVTGGSGVLVGAQTGQVEATIQRKLNPRWQGSLSVGYATNGSLIPRTSISGSQYYNSWYAAARINHQLSRGASFFVSYGARLQATNAAGCTASNCTSNFIGHELSVGFNFGLRPISIQ